MISASPEELYKIACRAIEHQKAQDATRSAKHTYHHAWKCYEIGQDGLREIECDIYVSIEDRISSGHPQFFDAQEATAVQFKAFKDAKRAEYNAKRRLETAIRSMK
jgi:hypothetical protein